MPGASAQCSMCGPRPVPAQLQTHPVTWVFLRLFPKLCLPIHKWECMHVCLAVKSCPTLCNPKDCSLPDSSVHGILQARIPERVAISSCRGSLQPRDPTCISCVSCIGRRILYHCATRKAHKWEEMVLKVPSHPQKQAVRPWHRLCREPGDPGLESQLYVSGTVGVKG